MAQMEIGIDNRYEITLDEKETHEVEFDELYDTKYVSVEEFQTTDMKYKFVIEIYDDPEEEDTYILSLDVVKSPIYFPMRKRKEMAESEGIPYKELEYSDIHSNGLCASVSSEKGKDKDAMLKLLRRKAVIVTGMLGFFLDQPQNRAGDSGWYFINGR